MSTDVNKHTKDKFTPVNLSCQVFIIKAISLTAIKDLYFEAFVISKVLIIVLLRVARYIWKEEIEGWHNLYILKYSVLIGSEEERIKE